MRTRVRIDRINFAVALVRSDMTVARLAELTGLCRATISAIKNGRSCRKETADKLVAVLGSEILEVTE
ncbi:MAG: helix-turn-helix domain-containing protein [Oscillospiraceae bacterium]|jgi:plasmid maintenance system antidote protein VapI